MILLILSGFLAVVELLRHGHGTEAWAIGALLAIVMGLGARVFIRLRRDEPDVKAHLIRPEQIMRAK